MLLLCVHDNIYCISLFDPPFSKDPRSSCWFCVWDKIEVDHIWYTPRRLEYNAAPIGGAAQTDNYYTKFSEPPV